MKLFPVVANTPRSIFHQAVSFLLPAAGEFKIFEYNNYGMFFLRPRIYQALTVDTTFDFGWGNGYVINYAKYFSENCNYFPTEITFDEHCSVQARGSSNKSYIRIIGFDTAHYNSKRETYFKIMSMAIEIVNMLSDKFFKPVVIKPKLEDIHILELKSY